MRSSVTSLVLRKISSCDILTKQSANIAFSGIGMVLSAIFEIILGNTYAYTVLAAFGLFYAGFGFIITP